MNKSLPLAACLMFAGIFIAEAVLANPKELSQWKTRYSVSDSGTANCQLCHEKSNGGDGWNTYGWDIRTALESNSGDIDAAFVSLENQNSDSDPAQSSNLTEINANTQPGWTDGPVNAIFFKEKPTLFNQPPPSLGTLLDPPIFVDLSGTIKTAEGSGICAMVLASGQFMFSCNPIGALSLTDLPREQDGTVKRQIYADGFFPKVDILTESTDEAVVMTRSGTCPSYNTPYDPAFVPGSAGTWINISGKVLSQDSQTPICAMVLANGQHMFSCDSSGSYDLNIPLDTNGQFKLQVYADGFAPTIQTFDESKAANDARMARAVECQAP